jgi:hypothetical protein
MSSPKTPTAWTPKDASIDRATEFSLDPYCMAPAAFPVAVPLSPLVQVAAVPANRSRGLGTLPIPGVPLKAHPLAIWQLPQGLIVSQYQRSRPAPSMCDPRLFCIPSPQNGGAVRVLAGL